MLKLALGVLLAGSIGLKIAMSASPAASGGEAALRNLAVDLDKRGFVVGSGAYAAAPFLEATRGACHLIVVEARPQGWNVDAIRQLARSGEIVRFAYGDFLGETPPRIEATVRHHWSRLLVAVGLSSSEPVLYGIVNHPSCGSVLANWLSDAA